MVKFGVIRENFLITDKSWRNLRVVWHLDIEAHYISEVCLYWAAFCIACQQWGFFAATLVKHFNLSVFFIYWQLGKIMTVWKQNCCFTVNLFCIIC